MASASSDETTLCNVIGGKNTTHNIRWSQDNTLSIESITLQADNHMTKVTEKFKSLNKFSNKFTQLGKKKAKNPKVSDFKSVVGEALKFLDSCTDLNSNEAGDALENITQLSEVEVKDTRKKIAVYLTEQNYCQVFVKVASGLQKCRQNSETSTDQQWFYNLILLESAFANFAYECPNLGSQFGSQNGPQVLFQDLQEIRASLSDPTVEWAGDLASATLGVLHSCFFSNAENREIYKAANAEDILSDYSKVTADLNIQATSLLLLLYLTGDLNSDLLDGNLECVGHLTKLLKQAVDCKDHVAVAGNSRLSARELLQCLNLMAANDENREEIEKHGGVVTMNKMLQPDFSEEEQRAGAVGLWNMARCESGKFKTSAVKDLAMKSLKSLGKSANKALREASTFALWELEGRFRSKPAHRTEAGVEPETTACKTSKSKVPHVMISYQWGSQKRALEIRDELVKAGYKVWMDVDKMKGNILTAMADAVEKAAVVVVCMTRKYKESLNCRSEASYAYKHAKPIVPVILEEGYKPGGWLGLFVGMQLYYELFSTDLMKKNIPALIRDIGKIGAATEADEMSEWADSTVTKDGDSAGLQHARRASCVGEVQSWSKQRVQKWFKENGLKELCSPLKFCDGKHLQDMCNRYQESPESFRNEIKSDLKLSFTTSVKFTTALDKLSDDS